MDVSFSDVMDIINEKDELIDFKNQRINELEKRIDHVITYIEFACYDMSAKEKEVIINTLRGKKM